MVTKTPSAKVLADKADEFYKARAKRLAEQKKVDVLEKKEQALKQFLIDNLPASQVGGVIGKVAQVEIVKKDYYSLEDRPKFMAYVKKSGETDLLTSSLNMAAVKERYAAGKTLPGVVKHQVKALSVHKVKK